MSIKLVTIDIDGTLIRDDLTVSLKTADVIKKVLENNIIVVLCTGRPHVAAVHFADMFGIGGFQIAQNGAYIKNNLTGEIILHDRLTKDIAIKINRYYEKNPKLSLSVLYGDDCFYEKQDEYAMHVNLNINFVKPQKVQDIEKLICEQSVPPTKLLITGEEKELDDMRIELKDLYDSEANILKSGQRFLDIINKQSSKGRALKILSKKLGIKKEEIMAIGDNFNDLDMIEFAGIGVAMGNAPDEVKRKADLVAPSNNDDGVAYALERLI